jgi:hypothetical protein
MKLLDKLQKKSPELYIVVLLVIALFTIPVIALKEKVIGE